MQDPRRDFGGAGAKNISDVLENDTKANFQENNPGKGRLQKKKGGGVWSPCIPPAPTPQPPPPAVCQGTCNVNKKDQKYRKKYDS